MVNACNVNPKILPCVFLLDVLCAYRKSEHFTVMRRCETCRHFLRFVRELEEEEEEFWKEAEKTWKSEGA